MVEWNAVIRRDIIERALEGGAYEKRNSHAAVVVSILNDWTNFRSN